MGEGYFAWWILQGGCKDKVPPLARSEDYEGGAPEEP